MSNRTVDPGRVDIAVHDTIRACSEAKGPPFDLLRSLPFDAGADIFGARAVLVMGVWFLLRGVEDAHVSLHGATVLGEGRRGCCSVRVQLPVSKAGQKEAGNGRAHDIGIASGDPAGLHSCAACTDVDQVEGVRAGWRRPMGSCRSSPPWSARVSTEMAIRAMRRAAFCLALARGPLDAERLSRRSSRVGGAKVWPGSGSTPPRSGWRATHGEPASGTSAMRRWRGRRGAPERRRTSIGRGGFWRSRCLAGDSWLPVRRGRPSRYSRY